MANSGLLGSKDVGPDVTFAEYFVVLQRRWRVWGTGLLLGLGAAILLTSLATVKYTATTTSFVTVSNQDDTSQGQILQGAQFAVQRMSSYAALSNSPEVLDPVIDELDLSYTTRELRKHITVTSPAGTVLLDLSVTDPDPELAAAIANAVSAELGKYIQEIDTPVGSTVSNVKVTIFKPSSPPSSPSAPRTTVNLILGIVAGFALGFMAAVLRHHLDRRIKSPEDVRNLSGMSALGATMRESDFEKRPLVALDWRSASAERYRTIRTALKFATVDKNLQHFVISSPLAGDGKTTVSCNLAISWAHSGARVCLVEADLRRPNVSRFLGLEGNLGLSDVLVGEAALDDVLVPWHNQSVTVLPAGSLPPDPAAILGTDAMHTLVDNLRTRFDVVIYDSPPLLQVTDAAVLAQYVDGVLLVVRWGRTTREQLATCVEVVRGARVPLLGTVLAAMKTRGKRARHGYYSSENLTDRAELPLTSGEIAAGNGVPKRETTTKH